MTTQTDKWQPIETAPKDGTRFLIGRAGFPWTFVANGKIDEHGNWKTGPDHMDFLAGATHWHPLPRPPVETDGEWAQMTAYGIADSLYKRGYTDRQKEKDYDPRGCREWQRAVDSILTTTGGKLR